MEILVRKATPGDMLNIMELVREFAVFLGKGDEVKTTLRDFVKDKKFSGCLVAETEDKKVVGYAFYCFLFHTWTGRTVYVDDLYVKEEYRLKGAGLKLMKAVIDVAKKNECIDIRWQVLDSNASVIEFYKKIGAKVIDNSINCIYSIGH